jgi:hypothetical protein
VCVKKGPEKQRPPLAGHPASQLGSPSITELFAQSIALGDVQQLRMFHIAQ